MEVTFRPVKANPAPELKGFSRQPGQANYLIGQSPDHWSRDIPGYAGVRYKDLYRGVDLEFHGRRGKVEYDFIVRAGADPRSVSLSVGASGPRTGNTEKSPAVFIGKKGDLSIRTSHGILRQPRPTLFQFRDGRRRLVRGGYVLRGNIVSFWVGPYDKSRALVIDPVLPFSSHMGGIGDDGAHAVARDRAGNAYITGWTSSADFPRGGSSTPSKDNPGTATTFCAKAGRGSIFAGGGSSVSGFASVVPLVGGGGCGDAFVAKLSPRGRLIYSTYFGGSGAEAGVAIAVDRSGSAYIAGHTNSMDLPAQKGFQTRPGAAATPDAFMAKLSPDGKEVAYATYLGGLSVDSANAIAVDAENHAYVAGEAGPGFPRKGGLEGAGKGPISDAFVAKINPTAAGPGSLLYATNVGGPNREVANGIAVDAKGSAYITGSAQNGFPTKKPLRIGRRPGGCASSRRAQFCTDAFVAKLNPQGSALDFASYLGGDAVDVGMGVALGSSGSVYLTGMAGDHFPTKDGFRARVNGASDAYLVKLSPDGPSIEYSTVLGGTGQDSGNAVAVDSAGLAWVAGATIPESSTRPVRFPVKNALQPEHRGGGAADAFVARFDPGKEGSESLEFSTLFGGGPAGDFGNGIAVNESGGAFLVGATRSIAGFPAQNALQPAGKGDFDAFMASISPGGEGAPEVRTVVPRSGPLSGGTTVTITGTGLDEAESVLFGKRATREFRVSKDGSRLVARTPAQAAGTVAVSVRTPEGSSGPSPAQFAYATGTWKPTAPTVVARSWPAAVRMADGKVLLAGGCVERRVFNDACGKASATAEVYDPSSKRWTPTGEMTVARHSGFGAALLKDGNVFVVGGTGPQGELLTSAEIYSPSSGKWTAAGSVPGARPSPVAAGSREAMTGSQQGTKQFSATSLPDGKVLVVGDQVAALFDPATGGWSPTGDRPLRLPFDHNAVLLPSGKVLVTGPAIAESRPGAPGGQEDREQTALFDPATGSWQATGSPPIGRIAKTATLLSNGQAVFAGGRLSDFEAGGRTEVYDPEAPDPTGPVGTWKAAGDLATPRYGHAAALLPGDKVLVVGGTYVTGGRLDSAEIYDSKTQRWQSAGIMAAGQGRGVSAISLEDGKVLVAGSGNRHAELYDPDPAPDRGPLAVPDGTEVSKGIGSSRLLVLAAVVLAATAAMLLVVRSRRRTQR